MQAEQDVQSAPATPRALPKAATGIAGLDEVLGGGLPRGRPTLVCGSAGCGKTLLAMEFLVRGATEFGEPGVFMSFEESTEELTQNVRSLGFDLDELAERGQLALEYVHVERSEIEETGEYDLEGLFIRLGFAIDSIGARRVVLDTLEALFSGLANQAILRAELRRLFRWLKDRGVTAVITGERGDGALTRYGLEEYICASSSTGGACTAPTSIRSSSTRTASRSCPSPPSTSTTRCRTSASPPASPPWTRCWGARGTTGGAAC